MNKVLFNIRRIFRSPLARGIFAAFVSVCLIEGALFAGLTAAVVDAEKRASREFALLQIAGGVSRLTRMTTFLFYDICYLHMPMTEEAARELRASVNAWRSQCKRVEREVASFAQSNRDDEPAIHEGYRGLDVIFNEVLQLSRQKVSFEKRREWERRAVACAGGMLEQSDKALGLIRQQTAQSTTDGRMVQGLLQCALAVNILMAVILMVLADRLIFRPIVRLRSECSKLELGQLMHSPASTKTEIGALEQTFFELSRVIVENERLNASNLELFSRMQAASLDRVKASLEAVSLLFADNARAKQRFLSSLKSVENLRALLADLTDALRTGASCDLVVRPSSVSLRELLDEVKRATDALLQKNHIVLKVLVRLPEVKGGQEFSAEDVRTEKIELHLDLQLISRVLINLVSNAIKHSPPDAVISIIIEHRCHSTRFSVVDQGPGMTDDERKALFERFRQVKAADGRNREGTGLGLVICKEIVEQHGGNIGCDSKAGSGSTFWFEVPDSAGDRNRPAWISGIKHESEPVKTKSAGLRQTFAGILLVLLIPQCFLFVELNGKFREAAGRAKEYQKHKQVMAAVEEAIFTYLRWRKFVEETTQTRNFNSVPVVLQQFRHFVKLSYRAYHMLDDGLSKQRMRDVLLLQKNISETIRYCMSNILAAHQGHPVFAESLSQNHVIMRQIFAVLEHEGSKIAESYDLSEKLKNEIMNVAGTAVICNLLTVLILSALCLNITGKIAMLRNKASEFASGKAIQRSIKGTDELAYLDQRLTMAAEAIKQHQANRSALIAVINHDLRTPLSSLLATLQLSCTGTYGPLPESTARLLAKAECEINELLTKVNNLLLLEKIEAAALIPTREVIDLPALTREVIEAAMPILNDRSLVCNFYCSSENIRVTADERLLSTLVASVVNNAIKASPPGAIISVSLVGEAGPKLIISDCGPGIHPDLRPQLFERFRSVNGKPVVGLGLVLAGKIARLHDACITVEPNDCGGTDVVVSLASSRIEDAESLN